MVTFIKTLAHRKCIVSGDLLLIAILSISAPAFASAPAGMPPKDGKEAFAKSDCVFLATVTRVDKDKLGFASQAAASVQRVWKGQVERTVHISGEGGPTYPARLFKVDDKYLFYLSKDLHADSFMDRVLPFNEAASEIKSLGKPIKTYTN